MKKLIFNVSKCLRNENSNVNPYVSFLHFSICSFISKALNSQGLGSICDV